MLQYVIIHHINFTLCLLMKNAALPDQSQHDEPDTGKHKVINILLS